MMNYEPYFQKLPLFHKLISMRTYVRTTERTHDACIWDYEFECNISIEKWFLEKWFKRIVQLIWNTSRYTEREKNLLTIPRYDKVLFECEKSTLISLRFLTVVWSEKEKKIPKKKQYLTWKLNKHEKRAHEVYTIYFSDTLNLFQRKRKWNRVATAVHFIFSWNTQQGNLIMTFQ